ncbi:STAS domain-containing protein [Leeuwenhoekiella nanhaiensis]|uniref:STAS domain-containing protein n=1 Tax=Leeuwenhoekiella nanhaiensis TaxID=1655491 RepID=A0A2G1VPV8_9FLAO|nr:STAS domain-containing protein [Leeuwenhoekiella nanhaiensis]PHQ28509.1 hypothetical protein CJ305_14545 [Leeuwenhoekiella nanhaiensis]
MYTFIKNQNSLVVRGELTLNAVGELAATLNDAFKSQNEIVLDLSKLQELSLSTVMKLAQLQANYATCGKNVVFLGLENASVRSTFGLTGKRQLLQNAA